MSLRNGVIGGLVSLGMAAGVYVGVSEVLEADKGYERLFEQGKRQISGTVLSEIYQSTLSPDPRLNSLVRFCHEPERLESSYALKIQTDDKRIIWVSVIDGDDIYGIPVKKESIEAIIKEGTRISFPAGNMRHGNLIVVDSRYYPGETYFTSETQAGNKRADRIMILPKE